jgi:SAM-dependent methyltransferase
MSDTIDELSLSESGPRVEVRDWDWWSWFLQREYYGNELEQRTWERAASDVATAVKLEPGMRVLDLGSGCGEMVLRLALRGTEVTGIEHSTALVEHCRQVAHRRGIPAEFVAANMFSYRPEHSFDLILSLNTSFGYGTDEQNRALIASVGRWLSPGGRFYLDLITADHAEEFGHWTDTVSGGTLIVDNTYDVENRRMTSYPTWITPDDSLAFTAMEPEVVQLYLRKDLEEMMREAGLEPRRLDRAMGRRFTQDDEQMLTTWIATKPM